MREWYRASELAGLPGLPSSKRRITTYAKREGWLSTTKNVRGGKADFYHWSSLPAPARAALFESNKAETPTTDAAISQTVRSADQSQQASITLHRLAELGGQKAAKAWARVCIIKAWCRFCSATPLARSKAVKVFVDEYNAGRIEIEEEVPALIPDISRASLYRWEKSNGTSATPATQDTRHITLVDQQPELREFLVAMLIEHPSIKVANLARSAESRFSGLNIDVRIPSVRRLGEWCKRWKQENAELLKAETHPDAWKSQYMLALGSSSEGITAPNQLWELDSTPADLMLKDGRHSIIGAVDIYTRRAKMVVVPASTAAGIALLMRKCILAWGVPQAVKTDRGADYMSVRTRLTLEALNIDHVACPPFQPWHKPHVERFFRTFSHSIVELLPGYIGHNVAERSQIEDRKAFSDKLFKREHNVDLAQYTAAEFQAICDQWVDGVYHQTKHSGINATPIQQWAEWPGYTQSIEDERLLDVLLAEVEARTITKSGVTIKNITYIAPEFGAISGHSVTVRLDPQDVGRVYCFSQLTGEFICIAEAPEYTGIDRQEVATAAKRIQREKVKEGRKQLRAITKQQNVKGIADEILAEARRKANVSTLPRPTKTHTGPSIAAAADAVRAMSHQPTEETAKQKEVRRQVAKNLNQTASITPIESPAQKYQRWLRLETRVNSGDTLDRDERRFFDAYPTTPQYKAQRDMAQSFGASQQQGKHHDL
jgi:hypothetical protein